jgi:hypothetical protein
LYIFATFPMVCVFDAALGAVTASGDYDATRACAGTRARVEAGATLEQAEELRRVLDEQGEGAGE